MNDYIRSMIRTFVPLAVGSIVTWLAARGVNVDANSILPAVDAIVAAGYYALVRWAESRWPQAGWLLGSPGAPVYANAPVLETSSGSDDAPAGLPS